MCPWPSICFHGLSGKFLDLLPPTSLPPVQKRDAQHMFSQHNRSHTEYNCIAVQGVSQLQCREVRCTTKPSKLSERFSTGSRHGGVAFLFLRLQKCSGAKAGKCPKKCFSSDFGHSEPNAQNHSESTLWSTFWPGPLSWLSKAPDPLFP